MYPDGVIVKLPLVSIGLVVLEETVTSESSMAALHSGQRVVRARPETSWVCPQW